jgi:hypothetical protein
LTRIWPGARGQGQGPGARGQGLPKVNIEIEIVIEIKFRSRSVDREIEKVTSSGNRDAWVRASSRYRGLDRGRDRDWFELGWRHGTSVSRISTGVRSKNIVAL